MFVLLEHDTTACQNAPDGAGLHWDLLLEVPGREPLATWRLAADPRQGKPVPALRIGDHRRRYLTYEGPLSEDRGVVRRIDEGAASVVREDAKRLVLRLEGRFLAGIFEIAEGAAGLEFRAPGVHDQNAQRS